MPKIYKDIKTGWNLIGCPPEIKDGINLKDFQDNYGLQIDENSLWSFENGVYTKTTELIPGRGYWIKVISNTGASTTHDLITLTSLFPNSTHLEKPLKTSNAFLFKISEDGDTFLITTAHTILDDPLSQFSTLASQVKCQRNNIDTSKFWYSRYYDVAVLKTSLLPSGITLTGTPYLYSTESINNIEHVISSFIDTESNRVVSIGAKHIKNINAHISLGALTHRLKPGSSGSAVMKDSQIIGMVTSVGENYDNMTLTIPIETIRDIIETISDWSSGDNFDTQYHIYPGLITHSLQSGHLEFLTTLGITDGEIVISSENDTIKPFDIITSYNGNNICKNNRLSNSLLKSVSDSVTSHNVNGKKLSDSWRKKYATIPRYIIMKEDFAVNYKKWTPFVELDNFSVSDNVITINDISLSLLETEDISDPAHTLQISDFDTFFLVGQQILIKEMNLGISNTYLATITNVRYYLDSSEETDVTKVNTLQITVDSINDSSSIQKIIIHNTTGVSWDLHKFYKNGDDLGNLYFEQNFFYKQFMALFLLGIEQQPVVTQIFQLSHTNKTKYKVYKFNDNSFQIVVILFLVRHWASLVLRQLSQENVGRQLITWSHELKKLTTLLSDKLSFNETENVPRDSDKINNKYWLYDMSETLIVQCLIFSSYLTTNFMNIFWQIWGDVFDIPYYQIELNISALNEKYQLYDLNNLDNQSKVVGYKFNIGDNQTLLLSPGNLIRSSNKKWLAQITNTHSNGADLTIVVLNGVINEDDTFKGIDQFNEIEYTVDSQPEKIFLDNLKDGNNNYNIPAFSSEYYQLKPNLSQINQGDNNRDYLVREIELTLEEIKSILNGNISITDGYQPRFFSALQSFWDHSHLTMAGIMNNIDGSTYVENNGVSLTTSNMSQKPYLSTWNFRRLLQGNDDSS